MKAKAPNQALPANLKVSGNEEQKLIGALVMCEDADAIDDVFATVRSDQFSRREYAIAFEIVQALRKADRPNDLEFVLPLFAEKSGMSLNDGAELLANAIEESLTSNLPDYGRAVFRQWQTRELSYGMLELDDQMSRADISVDDAIAKLRERLDRVESCGDQSRLERSRAGAVLLSMISEGTFEKEPEVFPFGLPELDTPLKGGLRRKQLVFVGARPSVGKTILGGQYALRQAQRGHTVLYLSYEIPREEMIERWMKQSGLRIDDPVDTARFDDLRLWIEEAGDYDIDKIEAVCRADVKHNKLDVMVVDYLGLIPQANSQDHESKHLADVTRRLKKMALKFNIQIMVLAQFNRKVEGRDNPRPRMSDFRQAGSIEQDADILLGLHRDLTPMMDQDAMCFLMKHRGGPTADVRLMFHKDYAKFVEPAVPEWGGE